MSSTTGIIATYNQVEYLAEAVAGLVGQVDELIVIDDASTDGTEAALASLSAPNLRVIRNEKQLGVSRSYNRAITAATNEIILIQGGDDRSLPHRARLQSEALQDPNVSLVHSVPQVIDSHGRSMPDAAAAEFLSNHNDLDPLLFLLFHGNFVCAPSAALRRSDYLRLGGFRGGIDLLQDYGLWLELAAEGEFLSLEIPVVEYRKHSSNLSREYVGIDAPKQRRLSAEMEFLRNHFLNVAAATTLEKIAIHCGIDLSRFTPLPVEDQIALLQLSHPDRMLVRRGLSHVFMIAGHDNAEERLESMGLSLADISYLANRADHDNLADVGRALSTVHALNELSNDRN